MRNIHQLQKELTFGTGELWTIKEDVSLECFYRSKGLMFNLKGNKIITFDATYETILGRDVKKLGCTIEPTSDGPTNKGRKTYKFKDNNGFDLVEYVKYLENDTKYAEQIKVFQDKFKTATQLHTDFIIPVFPALKHINVGYYGLRFGMLDGRIGSYIYKALTNRGQLKLSAVIENPSSSMIKKVSDSLTDYYHDNTLLNYELRVQKTMMSISVSAGSINESSMSEFMRLLKESDLQTIFSLIHNDLVMGVR